MTELLLIRHGMTDAVGHALVGRKPGVGLNERGRWQALALGAALARAPLRAIYSSPLERAVQTARAIAEPHRLGVELAPSLTDVEFGAWTARTLVELADEPLFRRYNAHRAGTIPPGGEAMVLAQARVVVELCRIREEHPHALVAVVGHADPLRAALAFFIGFACDRLFCIDLEPGSITRLELSGHGARLRSLNHVPGEFAEREGG